jgi:fumarylacetoacetase
MPSALGEPVAVDAALEHIFGLRAVNDWSARDIQAWEYPPARPVPGQSRSRPRWPRGSRRSTRCSTAASPRPRRSPPARVPARRPLGVRPRPRVELNGTVIARTSARHLYWSAAQQLAHLTVNGASLRVGDLFASGTISGPEREQRGCLLELAWNGAEPIELADGSARSFLLDGDEVVLRGGGADALALGEVRGRIEPGA